MELAIQQENNKPKHLSYLAALKFVAMALIIMWHVVDLQHKPFDIGARMCEFLIVASGFLVGYNHFRNPIGNTINDSLRYTYKRLRTFYPLHLICLVLIILLNASYYFDNFDLTMTESLFANIFLVQAWSAKESVVFSFNGISWFLSALLVCYLLSPLFLKFMKNLKRSLIIFLIVLAIRVWIELAIKMGGDNIFDVWFHANPAIKVLEFLLGMLVVPLFFFIKDKIDKFQSKPIIIISTFIEILMPIGAWFVMYYLSGTFIRAYFVLFFVFCVFVSAFNTGYVSKFFEMKIPKHFLNYQMAVFMFHLVVNEALKKVLNWTHLSYPDNNVIKYFIILFFIIVVGAIYTEFLSKRLSNLMDKTVRLVRKFIS